jgi:RNA polymerase sigma-70 factor (ECF subfamily)
MLVNYCTPYDPAGSKEQVTEQSTQLQGQLNHFFSEIEKRAYHMANYALGNADDALDAVQDAMLGLTEKYSHKPTDEWRPLFYTILQSRIRDRQRRATVRKRFGGLLSLLNNDESNEADPFQETPDLASQDPEQSLSNTDTGAAIKQALRKLPYRQQQTFLLRIWEGCSVKQTAAAIGCSEGTVKTHLSRAMAALRDELGELYHAE